MITRHYILIFILSTSSFLLGQEDLVVQPKESFTYGTAYSYQDCIEVKEWLDLLGIKNGHSIAGVGAADGYFVGTFSVVLDSSIIYIQDIDKNYLNEDSFSNTTDYYNRLRGSPQTNDMQFVIGDKKRTNLPKGQFDVVFIKNSYHEFRNKKAMLKDIASLLKPEGRVIISDEFTTYKKGRVVYGCNHKALKYEELHSDMRKVGLFPIQMLTLKNSWWNTVVYSFNEQESTSNYKDFDPVSKLDSLVSQIGDLDNKYFVRNLRNIERLKNKIIKYKDKIDDSNRFIYLPTWIANISSSWLKKKEYEIALAIAKINIEFNLDNAGDYVFVALIYEKKKDYRKALKYYKLAQEIDPNSVFIGYLGAKSKVDVLEELIK